MVFRQSSRSLWSVLLLLALLMQALLPAVASAHADSGARWIEICSASSIKWIKLDASDDGRSHTSSDHCVLCAATGAAPGFDVHRHLRSDLVAAQSPRQGGDPVFAFPGHAQLSRGPPIS